MKFKELLDKNHDAVYNNDPDEQDDMALQAKVVTETIDEYFDYLNSKYPNTSVHNEDVISDWSELMQQTALGNEIMYQFEDVNDEEFQKEYTHDAMDYVKKYGSETYYNVPFEDETGYWHVSVLDERDIMNIIDSYDRFKF